MYFLFRFHHITPSQYVGMGQGEKKIIRQLMYRQLEDMKKEYEGGD
jgi:hypothetical protein